MRIRRTTHERLDHLFMLSWKRNEKLNRKLNKIMSALDDLAREVEETKQAVADLLVKQQELIDQIANAPNNSAAVTAAVDALNELQAQIAAAVGQPTT